MLAKLRSNLTFANAASALALFVALSTGGAYAAHETIFSDDIVDGEVQNPDLGADSVSTAKIQTQGVANSDIAPNAITATRLATDSVETSEIRTGNVFNADIAGGTIASSRIADDTLTDLDIGLDSIGSSELKPNAVGSAEVANNSLTGADVNESTLGQVASAANSDNTGTATAIDIPDEGKANVLQLSGLGELAVTDCETTTNQDMTYGWDNNSSTNQDVWADTRDVDDTAPPIYAVMTPADNQSIMFSGPGTGTNNIVGTLRIRPVTSESFAATIHMVARVDATACRVSTRVELSQ